MGRRPQFLEQATALLAKDGIQAACVYELLAWLCVLLTWLLFGEARVLTDSRSPSSFS